MAAMSRCFDVNCDGRDVTVATVRLVGSQVHYLQVRCARCAATRSASSPLELPGIATPEIIGRPGACQPQRAEHPPDRSE